jgi:methylase of polypeptide subunit release factors
MPQPLKRLPESERLSIPIAGRTLLSSTRLWAEPLLKAYQQLQIFIGQEINGELLSKTYKQHYSFLRFDSGHSPTPNDSISLSSAALILNWLVGQSTGCLKADSTLSEAERWCLGPEAGTFLLSENLPAHVQSSVLSPLANLDYGPTFLDILPYAAEVFETSEEILKAYGVSRKSKKAAGIFYTPSDVADYVISRLANAQSNETEHTWLDPACGTGCFLLSALYKAAERKELPPGGAAFNFAVNSLYGVDISPVALQSAAYTIVLATMQDGLKEAGSLRRCLSLFGKNLIVTDATRLKSKKDLGSLSPSLTIGVDFIVSNPPYVKRKTSGSEYQGSLFSDENGGEEESESLYLRFIRMMPLLSSERVGGGGMVVPLSIAYNTRQEFQRIRQNMWSKGEWHLAHYDRTPDSLFGDDVKTRNTIVFFSQEEGACGKIKTSDLLRWNSRSREKLFAEIRFSSVPQVFRNRIIPKIGDDLGQELLIQINRRSTASLGKTLTRLTADTSFTEGLLRNSSTAYNWLPFELVTDVPTGDSFTRYRYWASQIPEESKIIFSLLQSRIAYWLWRVWGDGFHLTDQFVLSLPLSPVSISAPIKSRLETLGTNLWAEMQGNKVTSRNAGVVSTSYCAYLSEGILDEIDEAIIAEYNLPSESLSYLKTFIERTIVAGREDEIKVNPALRKWLNKEERHEAHYAGN